MQDRYLCCPPTFSLAPQWPPHFFHSRIATVQAAVETEADLQLPQTRCVLCSDSTPNEQVKTSVCHINFDGSSADVTFFSSPKILLVWEVFGWLRVICILSKACSFASWKILTQTRSGFFLRKMLGTRYGLVGIRFL